MPGGLRAPCRDGGVIERYVGAFLDEIVSRGSDVNETAEDLGDHRLKNVGETVRTFRIALDRTNGAPPVLATASA